MVTMGYLFLVYIKNMVWALKKWVGEVIPTFILMEK